LKIISFNYEREPPWFFPYIENYFHFFYDIKFECKDIKKSEIKFSLNIKLDGFNGVVMYIYKPKINKIEFDLISFESTPIQLIKDLHYFPQYYKGQETLDFIIIPFGYFNEENKLITSIRCNDTEYSYQMFSWIPSLLFKNVKSVIKVGNVYRELIPLDDGWGYYFEFSKSFKGNKKELLSNLVNIISRFDENPNVEISTTDLKSVIKKTNDFIFTIPNETKYNEFDLFLVELKRLRNNISQFSKEDLLFELDSLIKFYSRLLKSLKK